MGLLKTLIVCLCAPSSLAGPCCCVMVACSVSLVSDCFPSRSLTDVEQKVLKKPSHMGHREKQRCLVAALLSCL